MTTVKGLFVKFGQPYPGGARVYSSGGKTIWVDGVRHAVWQDEKWGPTIDDYSKTQRWLRKFSPEDLISNKPPAEIFKRLSRGLQLLLVEIEPDCGYVPNDYGRFPEEGKSEMGGDLSLPRELR